MRLILTTFLLIASATAASAQSLPYASPEADTLRYRERATEVRTMSWPERQRVVTMSHEAETILVFSDSGTAEASFEDLYIRLTTEPEGWLSEPLTDGAIGTPFVLRFGSDGRVDVVETPPFPQVLIDVSDLRWWFEDVFPPLPERSLAVGETWVDTLRTNYGPHRSVTRAGRYTVSRDTTVQGVPAYVIDFVTERSVQALDTRQAFPDSKAGSTLSGREQGTAYVTADRSVLLGLSLSGTMSGEWTSSAGSHELVVPEEVEYTRTLDLISDLSP